MGLEDETRKVSGGLPLDISDIIREVGKKAHLPEILTCMCEERKDGGTKKRYICTYSTCKATALVQAPPTSVVSGGYLEKSRERGE